MTIRYNRVDVDGVEIFYRSAGDPHHPTILLLHGFPSSSHMFRGLIPELASQFHVVAPDYPGFGMSDQPARDNFTYSFHNIANVIERFTERLELARFALYVFDYGAPIGFRIALRHPERVAAIITQNGNAYEEGLSEAGFALTRAYWAEPSEANRNALRGFLTPEATVFQYLEGAPDPALVSPDGYNLDSFFLARAGNHEIQLDLLLDYRSNVAYYERIHAYLRAHRPPLLAIWGRNDPFFLPAGAEAFRRDLPDADIRFVDAGHFALETHAHDIAAAMREFLPRHMG